MCPGELGANFHHLFFPNGLNKDNANIHDMVTYVTKVLGYLNTYHEKAMELRPMQETVMNQIPRVPESRSKHTESSNSMVISAKK